MLSVWSELRFDCYFQLSGNGREGWLGLQRSRGQGEFFPKGVPGEEVTYLSELGLVLGGQEAGPCERGPQADKAGGISEIGKRQLPRPMLPGQEFARSQTQQFESCLCCWPAA